MRKQPGGSETDRGFSAAGKRKNVFCKLKTQVLSSFSLVKGVKKHVIPLGSFLERFDLVFAVVGKQCSCFWLKKTDPKNKNLLFAY